VLEADAHSCRDLAPLKNARTAWNADLLDKLSEWKKRMTARQDYLSEGVIGRIEQVAPLLFALCLLCSPALIIADDAPGEVQPCSFVAHTPIGTLTGACTTQNIPKPGFREYWNLTLTFDQQSAGQAARLQPDHFYDMFRSQSLEDGSSTVILPLWGDFLIKPADPEYVAEILATAPLYETRPHEITISVIGNAPLTVEILFKEHSRDFDPIRRSLSWEWMLKYLESFRRLGTNRPDGFSK
jgi:hypothetical protein